MAKFIVTSGIDYQPFTYQELAAPVMQAAEAHREAQDVYDSLGMETAAIQRYIEQEPEGSKAREMYQGYLDKLTSLQDNLWANGYNGQTRRDLAAARAGYAGDIVRLQKAITDRQERSAKFWEKANDRSNIMGTDPGIYSLDKFITNDRFGQDFYSYNGNQFTQEVGTDAQARINEMMRDPKLYDLFPDYYTAKMQTGVTSEEVSNAATAIYDRYRNGSDDKYNNLSIIEKVLADVLDSHLLSTGAKDNVSRQEFDRLIEYGVAGLSHAIGKTDFETKDDWKAKMNYQLEMDKKKWDYEIANPKTTSGSGSGTKKDAVPATSSLRVNTRNGGYNEHVKDFYWDPNKKKGGTRTINTPQGTTSTYDSPVSMALDVYNPEIRQQFRDFYKADVLMDVPGNKDNVSFEIPNGENSTIVVSAHKPTGNEAELYGFGAQDPIIFRYEHRIEDENGRLIDIEYPIHQQFTAIFNQARKQTQDHIYDYESLPGNEHIRDDVGVLYPKEEQKYRKKHGYDDSISTEDIYHIEATKNYMGVDDYSLLASTDKDDNELRTNMSNRLINTYIANKDLIAKNNRFAFIPVKGNSPQDKGATASLENILGQKQANGTTVIKDENLRSIYVCPEDLVGSAVMGDYPKIRLILNNQSVYQTTAEYLGSEAYEALSMIMPNVTRMMEPLLHPEEVVKWSPEQAEEWADEVFYYLNGEDAMNEYYGVDDRMLRGPVKRSRENDLSEHANALDIVRDSSLRSELRSSINEYIWMQLLGIRDFLS